MYPLQIYLVTTGKEMSVVQRSRSSSLSMVYTTLENTLEQYEMEAMYSTLHDVHVQRATMELWMHAGGC